MTDAAIRGLGVWLPPTIRGNDFWPATFTKRKRKSLDHLLAALPESFDPHAASIMLREMTREAHDPFHGATFRRFADETVSAADAETLAARAALDDAQMRAEDIDIVLSHSVVPDRIFPATAATVAHRLGAHRASAFAADSACASGVAQLELAAAYVQSGMARAVLATQSHLMLRAFPPLHPFSPCLGDAATAWIVTAGRGLTIRATSVRTYGALADSATYVRDGADNTPWWKAGSALRMGSDDATQALLVTRDMAAYAARTIRDAADRAHIAAGDINVLATMQSHGYVPAAIAESLGLAHERAVTTYAEFAHTGACGPLINLMRAREKGLFLPGKTIALYGNGAGLTCAAAILEVT